MKKISVVLFCISIFFAGCLNQAPATSYKNKSASTLKQKSIISKINDSYEKFSTLKASLKIKLISPSRTKPSTVKGEFVVEKPDRFYLKGYDTLRPNIFTIVAKESDFWLYLPKPQKVFTGPLLKLEKDHEFDMVLNPREIFKAIIVKEIDLKTDKIDIEETDDEIVVLVSKTIGRIANTERKIWLKKPRLDAVKELYYSPKGFVELEIARSDFRKIQSFRFAEKVRIERKLEREVIEFAVEKLKIDPLLKDDQFELAVPDDATVEKV